MKISCWISILMLFLFNPVSGSALTDQSRISILTLDPGEELYSIFGHTAIRVNDETLRIDRIYNFGTFDSGIPFFYIKFLQGELTYFLSVTDYNTFFANTVDERREIVEQVLDLTYTERLKMFNDLEQQYQSSARFYKYDFFYDNCATRIRDVVFNSQVNLILYDTSQFCCETFRVLLKPYISRNYWLDLGINLVLGKGADRKALSKDFMFLPEYIRVILRQTSEVEQERTLLEKPFSKSPAFNFTYLSPWILMTALLFLYFRLKFRRIVLKAFLVFFSMVGLILLTITAISVNKNLSGNANIWWTIPSLVILVVQNERISNFLTILYCAFLITLVFGGNILFKGFSITFLPWIITMAALLLIDLRWK